MIKLQTKIFEYENNFYFTSAPNRQVNVWRIMNFLGWPMSWKAIL